MAESLLTVQAHIKECSDYLRANAARKEAFITEKYYLEQIAVVREGKEEGWEKQIESLERMATE